METSNSPALLLPKLNITPTGTIPTTLQTFSVFLPCSGLASAEVNVTIIINVTLSHNNVTTLHFRRKKICTKFENLATEFVDTVPTYASSANIFYVAVFCALTLIVILACVMTTYYIKNKKTRRTTESNNGQASTFLATMPRNAIDTSYGSFRRMPSYSFIDERSKDLQERIADLTVQR